MVNVAIILAGGRGTRLRPLTDNLPKPLVPIQGKPVLEHLVGLFKKFGVSNIYFSIGYRGDQIRQHFGDGSKFGINAKYIEEKEPLGTAGCLRLVNLKERFFMCNGDELKDVDLGKMERFHLDKGGSATIALLPVDDPSQYGVAAMDGDKIVQFVEKPAREDAPSNLINSGLYLIEPEVASIVPEGFAMMEKDVFPLLAKQGRLFGFPFEGQWFDTGTLERYERAQREWKGIR